VNINILPLWDLSCQIELVRTIGSSAGLVRLIFGWTIPPHHGLTGTTKISKIFTTIHI
jgi:hypothetical protein